MNFTIYIFFYIFVCLSILGYGFLYFGIVNENINKINIGYLGLGGIFILIIFSYFTNFFFQHNIYHNIIILLFGIIFFLKSLKNYLKKNLLLCKLSIIVFAFLFISILIFKNHDDFPYYHFPYTIYLVENNLIYGVGNLNHGFRTPSSIFYLNSLFYLPLIKHFSFTFSAVYILGFSNLILLDKIFKIYNLNLGAIKKNKYNFINYLFLLTFIFINIFFYRIAEHGTDRSAQILVILLVIEILLFLNISKNKSVSPTLYLLVGIIISLKSFYILYLLFIIPIVKYFWSNKKKIFIFKKIFFNINFIPLLLIIIFTLTTFFFNTG